RVWLPFVLILLCGAGFVVGYYTIPAVSQACEHVTRLKQRFGYGFSAVGGLVAGVVIPELFKRLTLPGHRILPRLGELFMDAIYFVAMALMVDTLYRVLGWMFGEEPDFRTVVAKTLIDQFVFTPTFGTAIAAVYFPLRKSGWDFQRVLRGFGWGWYVRTVLPILLPAWVFWIPAVAMIYSLPPLLQMPFSLCVTAAWSLLLIVIARRERSEQVQRLAEAEAYHR
ncbi:MAG: hypothetical protein NZ561_10325, partial [Phycisphaerae bacterium]|nr:hypothetical protein [Phycisphaerae bacterium]MDW8261356.1 hypothetical protein [Phycisphaerales bacterium]